jgi:hypothetical protein
MLQIVSTRHVVLLSVRDHFSHNSFEKFVHPWSANPSARKEKRVTYLKALTV